MTMQKFKSWCFHTLYILAATVFFSWILFPSDTVSRFVENLLRERAPEMNVSIEKTGLSFPPGLTFSSVSLARENQSMLRADQNRILPKLTSLLKQTRRVYFDGEICAGRLEGKADITGVEKPDLVFDARVDALNIGEIDAVRNLPGYTLSGLLTGNISGNRTQKAQNGKTSFQISNLDLGLKTPLFNITGFQFTRVDAEMEMGKNTIKINKCIGNGPQIALNLTGSILLRQPVEKSTLNLKGTLKGRDETMKTMLKMLLRNPAGEFRMIGSFELLRRNPAAVIKGKGK